MNAEEVAAYETGTNKIGPEPSISMIKGLAMVVSLCPKCGHEARNHGCNVQVDGTRCACTYKDDEQHSADGMPIDTSLNNDNDSLHKEYLERRAANMAMERLAEPSANDRQVGGTHWTKNAVQTWDYIAANGIGYFEGNVIKYVSRWKDKGGVEDLFKAKHYLEKLIELQAESEQT